VGVTWLDRRYTDNVSYEAFATISNDGGWFLNASSIWQALVEQGNGTTCKAVASPNVGTSQNQLDGVSVVSANDIWAVGFSTTSRGIEQILTEHWNGSSWSVVASPYVGTTSDALNAVAAVSTTDLWAVGYANGQSQTLIEHWNGTNWSVVPNNVGTSLGLNGLAVISGSDIWAVGDVQIASSGTQTLTEHWNGASWSVVPGIDFDSIDSTFPTGLAAVMGTNVWAVGYSLNSPPSTAQTLIEQYCC
jgi:hypothetical protein